MNFFDMIQDEAAFGLPVGNWQALPVISPFHENPANFRLSWKNSFTIPDSSSSEIRNRVCRPVRSASWVQDRFCFLLP